MQVRRPLSEFGHEGFAPSASQGVWFDGSGGGNDDTLYFRRFSVKPGSRRLLRDGRPVEIGARAFDLLIVLLRSRGVLVTKQQIVSYVWPSTVVEESNLRFQVASLRAVLGEDRDVIKTISGRGYLFAAEANEAFLEVAAPTGDTLKGEAPGPSSRPAAPGEFLPAVAHKAVDDPSVIVIDDDRDTGEALEGLLRSAGLRVEVFASVQAYLDSPRSTPPSCLVLDVWLPGRSGLDFQAELAKAEPNTPIIFISGYADVPMSVRAMKAGAIEFLTKPVRHEELLEAVRLAITRPV